MENNNEQIFDTFYEFKECTNENEYIKKYLGKNIDEASYQLAYDMSNDWYKDNPTWNDIETAFKVGIKYARLHDNLDANIVDYRDNEIKDLKAQLNWALRDSVEKETQLKDELDALNMRYLSQVSLYKSLYEKEKKKNGTN